jgi:hypothetical protein
MFDTSKAERQDRVNELLGRTLWGRRVTWALGELKARHPEAILEIAAVEYALTDAARELRRGLFEEEHPEHYMTPTPSSLPQVGLEDAVGESRAD